MPAILLGAWSILGLAGSWLISDSTIMGIDGYELRLNRRDAETLSFLWFGIRDRVMEGKRQKVVEDRS